MENFRIDTLYLISGGNPTSGILLQALKGLDGPNQRTNSYSKPGEDGGGVSSQLYDIRQIELDGKIEGDSIAEYNSLRQSLISIVRRRRDDSGYPLPVRVYFTTLDGVSYYVDCYFDKPVMDMTSPVSCDFMVTARATDPFIYADVTLTSSAISPARGGGYRVPMVVPYISAGSTGGSSVINNPGMETAWPRVDSAGNGGIQLIGPLTSPVITNLTTGKYLQITYNIPSGAIVKIDMFNRTITLNGASLISTKTASSDWWGLEPGDNRLSLTTSNNSDTGSFDVSFNAPYIGV